MGKIEKLLDKTKRNGETKKWKMYVFAVVGILVVLGGFFGVVWFADVDGYLNSNKCAPTIYDFYEKKVGENETAVFFMGSSIVGRACYPPEINQYLQEKGSDIISYSVYYSSDIPIERSLELQKVIDAKPSLVIYGVTYRSVVDEIDIARFTERINLVYDRLDVRPDSYYLFTDNELSIIQSAPNILYKKAFVGSALKQKIFGKNENAMTYDYMIDPYGEKYREILDSERLSEDEIIAMAENPNDVWRPIVTNEASRYKEALLYNVKSLVSAGIPVIIINMPLHPSYSEKITDESRENFFTLLNQTGVKWYDMEKDYGDIFFVDSHHASFVGAHMFSPRIADLIIQELT